MQTKECSSFFSRSNKAIWGQCTIHSGVVTRTERGERQIVAWPGFLSAQLALLLILIILIAKKWPIYLRQGSMIDDCVNSILIGPVVCETLQGAHLALERSSPRVSLVQCLQTINICTNVAHFQPLRSKLWQKTGYFWRHDIQHHYLMPFEVVLWRANIIK